MIQPEVAAGLAQRVRRPNMLRFSQKMFDAVEAVLHVAYHGGKAPVSGREIAKKQQLTPRHHEQLMQQLVKAGILRGVRGPKGGYVLAREKRRISLQEICAVAVESSTACPSVTKGTALGREVITPIATHLQTLIAGQLETIDLAELCERAEALHIKRNGDSSGDYII